MGTALLGKLLIVDDDEALRFGIRRCFEQSGFLVSDAATCNAAEEMFRAERPDAVLLDLQLPDGEGLNLLSRLRKVDTEVPVFVLSGYGSIDLAVRALKQGAQDFFTKPVVMERLVEALRRTVGSKPTRVGSNGTQPILGKSAPMLRLMEQVDRIRNADCPVLILGETGSGKSMLARYLHASSPRADRPFVDLNCATLSKDLLEAELFGYERGAFTGAHAAKAGLFEAANGGTLFLDEIGDIDVAVQPKILKVLEEKRYRRIGDVRERVADVRLVAATHKDLGLAMQEGTFRSDLYYRISTFYVTMPPLRERGEDIVSLAQQFLAKYPRPGGDAPELTEDARHALMSYPWKGNVRQLRNVLERSALLAPGSEISSADLAFDPESRGVIKARASTMEDVEREHIERALEESGGRVEGAARTLGLARSTLYLKIKTYGLVLSKFQTAAPKTG